ncbi:MAG TPA: hypothetical protein VGR69_03020 [Candidatus Rubrimentiphilum sp.]|nr:hypothetical protein [Candidatus Rubrimentiphilum sp.]
MFSARSFALVGQVLDEAGEPAVHGALQSFLYKLAYPRREARRRDGHPHRACLRHRQHGDETISGLVDAAQQETLAIGKGAQARREGFILRSGDHQECARKIGVVYLRCVFDPPNGAAAFGDRFALLTSFAIVSDHDANAAVEI